MTDPKNLETWLHEKAGPARDALRADPARAVSADQVRARLHDDAMAEAFREDPAYAVELLHSSLEDGDQGELLIALRQMTKAAGREMLTPFDPAEWLTSAEAVAAFLADAEATADPAYIEHAQALAARARAMHGIK
jgi:DNA-binding phage protein